MTYKHLFSLITSFFLSFSAFANSAPPDTIHLQLKWFHQFQFAGYYAAVEKGYYEEQGLDVIVHEIDTQKGVVNKVIDGDVHYAIGDSGIIQKYINGAPIVGIAAIFQHSPLVFISRKESGIISPYEMVGKRLMLDAEGLDEAPLRSMLNGANISTSDYTYIKHTYNKDDLINNSVDVISGYITDQPFYYKEQGLDVNVINPQNYGYDFYGDILFTSLGEVENNPGRVEKFKIATLKGWEYALKHPEEIIQLIKTKYQSTLSVDHLRYEAQETKKLILPDLIPIGDIQVDRMRRVAETYSQLSESKKVTEQKLKKFFYSEYQKKFILTNEEKVWLAQHPVLRVGIDNDFEPYEWVDKSGQYLGLTADYLSIVESKLGVEFEILKELNWSETLDHAASGKLHMIAGAVNTPKRRQFLEFTPAFISNSVVLISNEQHGFIGELSRLNHKKLAIENGYFLAELIKRDYPDIKVVKVDNIDEAFALVDSGQADAYAGDALATSYALKEFGYTRLRIAGVTDYTSATSMAVIKTEPILLSIINKALASITIDEEQSIRDFWMSSTPKSVISMKQILEISIALSLIFLILGY